MPAPMPAYLPAYLSDNDASIPAAPFIRGKFVRCAWSGFKQQKVKQTDMMSFGIIQKFFTFSEAIPNFQSFLQKKCKEFMGEDEGSLNIKLFICLITVLYIVIGGGAAGRAESRQIVGEDDFGRKIVLEKPPERIILLSGSSIDLIYELGAGDRLVGVVDTIGTSYPETCRLYPSVLEKERVGRFNAPNIEKIVSLAPDLIIPFASSETPGKYTTVFERRDMPYAAFVSVENVAFGIEQIKRMASVLGREKEGQALALKIRNEVDTLSKKILSRIKDTPLVYYWWGVRNGTYGAKAAITELIELAGGVNLAGQFDTQYMELSPEYVIASDPDVIVISYWREDQREERMAALKKRPGFSGVKAVKENRVYTIEGHYFHTIIRFAEAIQTLAEFIHPGVLGDSDPTGVPGGADSPGAVDISEDDLSEDDLPEDDLPEDDLPGHELLGHDLSGHNVSKHSSRLQVSDHSGDLRP